MEDDFLGILNEVNEEDKLLWKDCEAAWCAGTRGGGCLDCSLRSSTKETDLFNNAAFFLSSSYLPEEGDCNASLESWRIKALKLFRDSPLTPGLWSCGLLLLSVADPGRLKLCSLLEEWCFLQVLSRFSFFCFCFFLCNGGDLEAPLLDEDWRLKDGRLSSEDEECL